MVLQRQFQRADLLSRVWIGHVVADDEHGLWLWVATGSTYRDIAGGDGTAFREIPFGEWNDIPKALIPKIWDGDVLMFHPHDAAHSVWFSFTERGEFRSWYVNLEEPACRWEDSAATAGIDTIDYDLDIVVSPDRSWYWKDEDEFAYHLGYPDVYWVDDPAPVWAEGKRVVALIEAGEFPFDGTRTAFRPDPLWTAPNELSEGWDRRRAKR